MKTKLIIFIALMSSQNSFAQFNSLKDIAFSNLKAIEKQQVQKSFKGYFPGEFTSQIESTLIPILAGVGKPVGTNEEPTPFTTASVLNQLGSTYLEFPELQKDPQFQIIPKMFDKAIPTFERYRENDLYSFYPSRIVNGVKVHQPADMHLLKFWYGFTNTPADSDTTSVVYTALQLNAKINNKSYEIPEKTLQSLEKYRDLHREPHNYNENEGLKNTGAFMTWQFDENDPKMPRFYFARPEKGVRIPFNRNDIDCVVNLNVLRMLELSQKNIQGTQESCEYINEVVSREQFPTCGIYYPNSFNLAYSMGNLHQVNKQSQCLQSQSIQDSVKYIIPLQTAEGCWKNDRNPWVDKTQSTLFALHGLMNLGNTQDIYVKNALVRGTAYLLRHLQKDHLGNFYLEGEVFFTATALARSLVVWRSDAYTTALAASLFLKMQKLYPELDLKYYKSIKYEEEFNYPQTGA